jgi:hypothetical protein
MPLLKPASPKNKHIALTDFEGCQLPSVSKFQIILWDNPSNSQWNSFKRAFAYLWNYHIKRWLRKIYRYYLGIRGETSGRVDIKAFKPLSPFKNGNLVRVRSIGEIKSTLDPFNELKGCSFLPSMHQYCGTEQRVLKSMERFLDERDYKLKRTRGLILLENIFCDGTPVFGPCDRSCFLFWREEWLEKI